jgi:hypothetical protein
MSVACSIRLVSVSRIACEISQSCCCRVCSVTTRSKEKRLGQQATGIYPGSDYAPKFRESLLGLHPHTARRHEEMAWAQKRRKKAATLAYLHVFPQIAAFLSLSLPGTCDTGHTKLPLPVPVPSSWARTRAHQRKQNKKLKKICKKNLLYFCSD